MKLRSLVGLGTIAIATLLGACSSLPNKLTASQPPAAPPQPRTDADGSIQVGDMKRVYNLHVPSSYTGEQPTPLVLALHGAGGDGKGMEELTGFNQLAEQKQFIVVYPDAINKHWDARRRVQPETTNDIGFISALIEQLEQQYNLDRDRIYVTGFSNGGMFAHRVACELSDKIAAGAAVAATMPENLSRICQPSQPVSMLMIHGTADPAIPYGEGGRALLSVANSIKYWTTHNGCSAEAVQETLPGSSLVRVDTYLPCGSNATVMLYTIEGGEHAWPTSPAGANNASAKPSEAIDTSTVIWDFFTQHSAKPN